MALVSFENFIEPLRNKVYLIGILVAILMFAILRVQGGGIEIRTEIETPRLHNRAERGDTKKTAIGGRTSLRTPEESIPVQIEPRKHFMDEVLEEEYAAEEQAQQERTAPAGKDGGLDDIERMMGLR